MSAAKPEIDASQSLESGLLTALRGLATHKAARGLQDDCATLDWPLGQQLVATHDMLAEGVHFTPDCPAVDIGWKLMAVNLSDLAGSGARPIGCLMGAGFGADRDLHWAQEVVRGVGHALEKFEIALLGGDTIRTGPRTILSLTALGAVPAGQALERSNARDGDDLWVSGDIGAAGLGLRVALGEAVLGGGDDTVLLKRYRRPTPRLKLGQMLRGIATAAMDVSDGLLIDAGRMASASGLSVQISSADIPVSAITKRAGVDVLELAAMGDDYELLFAANPADRTKIEQVAQNAGVSVTRIGRFSAGSGLLVDGAPPAKLGYQHS